MLRKTMLLGSVLVLAVGAGVIVGCESEPTYIPPPTRAGIPDPLLADVADEMVDQMVQQLVVSLPAVPEVRNSPHQYVLAVAKFDATTFSEHHRFRAALDSIMSRLMTNQAFTDSFVVFATDADTSGALLRSISGSQTADFEDPAQRGPSIANQGKYDPRYVYMLTGKFYQIDEPGGKKAYRLFFNVEKPVAKQRILSEEFSRNLRWDGQLGRWQVED